MSGRADWQTPPALFERLHLMFGFTYDAFAGHENALLPTYSTPEGTFRKCRIDLPLQGEQIDSLDGFGQDWSRRRVFLNPPYSAGLIGRAVRKCAESRNEAAVIVAILPDARDTSWWREYVAPYAQDWPLGRVRFINPDTGKPGMAPKAGHVAALYVPDWLRSGNGGR